MDFIHATQQPARLCIFETIIIRSYFHNHQLTRLTHQAYSHRLPFLCHTCYESYEHEYKNWSLISAY